MKKKILFILALAVLFSACKMKLSENIGTVVIDFGSNERAVDSNGLPFIKDAEMSLEINSPSQGTQKIDFATGKEKKWSGSFPIGEKLTIKVAVKTAAAEWTGSAEHTVTEGTNTVAVKLSKAPKSVGNILIDVVEQNGKYEQVKFKLAGGKELVSQALIDPHDQEYLVTARDSIGRIYVLYTEGPFSSATPHFKRYDTEGNEDNGFEAAITGKLPSGVTLNKIKTMTVDAKTNTIFIVGMDMTGSKHAYAVTEKGHNNFTLSNGFDLTSFIGSGSTIQTAAAYNGTLFFTVLPSAYGAYGMENKLVAVKAELSGSSLTLSNKIEMELPKLRTAGAGGNYPTNCTGLFADADGVYCLLSDQNLYGGTLYALGQIVRYQYSGSAFTGETKIGLNPAASTADPIPFDAQYFSAPVGFIGYDEENIYIADDGVDIQYVNENYHVNGNKNRIAAFNRKTSGLTFTDTDATWYGQKPEYKKPETKVLLWKKGNYGMLYWTSTDGTDAFSEENKLFEDSPGVRPTDKFCYDQDGNLYIMYQDAGSNKGVRRFALKEDGSYEKSGLNYYPITSFPIFAIAVDISDGQNFLYYVYTAEFSGNTHAFLQRLKWNLGDTFDHASPDPSYLRRFNQNTSVTALAANKDGVFVGIKETYQDAGVYKYRLKVQKYKKSDGSPDAALTLVDGGIRYKDVSNNPLPVAPSSGDYKETVEEINGLQVVESVLYAATVKIEKEINRTYGGGDRTDVLKSSGKLYKVKETDAFSGSATELAGKDWNDVSETGYGFYRFIAVIPKKLVIASDGAWSTGGKAGQPPYFPPPSFPVIQKDTNKVLKYDLDGHLQNGEDGETAGGSFSKELAIDGCGFSWK